MPRQINSVCNIKILGVVVLTISLTGCGSTVAANDAPASMSKLAYQNEGDYTPNPLVANQIGELLVGVVIPVPGPLVGGVWYRTVAKRDGVEPIEQRIRLKTE